MTVAAIVQARMGSSRLPGKVLALLGGRPTIDWVVERVRRIPGVDQVIVATSTNVEETPLVDRVAQMGVAVFRGSPDDVLDRYYHAASSVAADVIVRVTADCPLLSPKVAGAVLARLMRDPTLDYCSNTLDRTFPRGLDTEAFTFNALETAWREASAPPDREHVTPFLYRNPERFEIAQVTTAPDRSEIRWTLDTNDDLALLSRLCSQLAQTGRGDAEYDEVFRVFESHPEWARLNAHVRQKAYGE